MKKLMPSTKTNILISYDRRYQGFILPVITSTIENVPNSDVYCMVTSDVTRFVNPNIRDINRGHFERVFGDDVFCGAFCFGRPG